MKTLLNWFGSMSIGAIWNKLKVAILVFAVSFMFWQGLQMTSLQKDVSNLETVQGQLQEQVEQVKENYKTLQLNYQLSAKTSEQYFDSVESLQTKSTELEKSFASLEKRSLPKGTTPREMYEKQPTGASGGLAEGIGVPATGDDLEWRKLLDNTFCEVQPADPKCTK